MWGAVGVSLAKPQGKNFSFIFIVSPIENKLIKHFSPDTGKYEIVTPRFVSVGRDVPEHIQKPDYYFEYQPPDLFQSINPEIKMENKIKKMRESCRLAGNILEKCSEILKVSWFWWISLSELTRTINKYLLFIARYNNWWHWSICTWTNNCSKCLSITAALCIVPKIRVYIGE